MMQDAIKINEKRFYIDGVETVATQTWITEYGEVFISLKHPRGGEMNVNAKHIHAYIQKEEKYLHE
jgi:hypothetical protein